MHFFSVKDVERVLRIPRSAIRTLISGGYVAPKRGRRRQYEFSFQDLVALRTARALILARVSPRRISQALRQLRKEVPPELPTAKLRIGAVGHRAGRARPERPVARASGQLLLEFDATLSDGTVEILDRSTLDVLQGEAGSKPCRAARARRSCSSRRWRWRKRISPRPFTPTSAASMRTSITSGRASTAAGCYTRPTAWMMRRRSIARRSTPAAKT